MLLFDIKVALKNLPTLPFVLGTFPKFSINGEYNINSYSSLTQYANTIKHSIVGTDESINYTEDESESIVYFMNGICTDVNLWAINASELERIFDFKVYPLYNRTNGIFIDLKDCIFGRTFDIEDAETKALYLKLKNSLSIRKKVIVFAHSQGGIIISQLVERLLFENNPNLHKLEVYTFASATDSMPNGNYYAEHFANSLDYVARIGVLQCKKLFRGEVYKLNYAGHLLNTHYLNNFEKGLYCNGQSRLYSYIKQRKLT